MRSRNSHPLRIARYRGVIDLNVANWERLQSAAPAMPGVESQEKAGSIFEPQVWVRRIGRCTPKTITVEIPEKVTSALHSGTFCLPNEPVPTPEDTTWYDGTAIAEEDMAESRGSFGNESDAELQALFANICTKIDDAIALLGGVVVPKLSTVAPSDATWVSFTRSLRCESATDVLTLIGASERAMNIVDGDRPTALALRSCLPAVEATSEFRVFVCRHAVVGLSQRDVGVATSFGQEEMDRVVDGVQQQFHNVVRDACASYHTGDAEGYVYDVYVDRQWRFWILDVAPWGPPTDDLLFSWEELRNSTWMNVGRTEEQNKNQPGDSETAARDASIDVNASRPQLRCVGATSALRPAQTMYDAMPLELRNLDAGDALAAAAKRMLDLRQGCSEGIDDEGSSSD